MYNCYIYIIGHYNSKVRIIDLVSHTTYVVCVNFIHKWRDLQFKLDSERQIFFEKLFMAVFNVSSVLSGVLLQDKIFLRRLTLSRFLAKTMRVNKISIRFLKKKNLSFRIDFILQTPSFIYKINTHNISGVSNQVLNLTKGLS